MILRVDPTRPIPVYEQIREQLVTMISSGALAPGVQLPTIRQLASDLGLAKGTVSKAYEALLHDGAIVSRGRHGTSVAQRPRSLGRAERTARLESAAQALALTAVHLGFSAEEAGSSLALAWQQLQEGAA